MAPQKYQLLGRDAEKGDSTYPAPPDHLNSSTGRAARSSGTFSIVLGAIGAFFSGVIFTLLMIDIKSNYYGMGQYETGFREEKLCKSACNVRMFLEIS